MECLGSVIVGSRSCGYDTFLSDINIFQVDFYGDDRDKGRPYCVREEGITRHHWPVKYWLEKLASGNPRAVEVLFLDWSCILSMNKALKPLWDNRHVFLSFEVLDRFEREGRVHVKKALSGVQSDKARVFVNLGFLRLKQVLYFLRNGSDSFDRDEMGDYSGYLRSGKNLRREYSSLKQLIETTRCSYLNSLSRSYKLRGMDNIPPLPVQTERSRIRGIVGQVYGSLLKGSHMGLDTREKPTSMETKKKEMKPGPIGVPYAIRDRSPQPRRATYTMSVDTSNLVCDTSTGSQWSCG